MVFHLSDGPGMICEVKRCKGESGLRYLGYAVCPECFHKFCETRKPNLKDEKTYKRKEDEPDTRPDDGTAYDKTGPDLT